MTPEYIAGFFDGEGCVSYRPKRVRPQITVAQNSRPVLEAIQEFVGCGQIYECKPGSFELRFTNARDKRIFAELVVPFSIVKREKLMAALEVL